MIRRPSARPVLAAVAALGLGAAAPHASALALYDDFSSGSISPFRWVGGETELGGASNAETRRLVFTGALRLEAKTYSDNTYAAGTGRGQTALTFVRAADITDIRATVTMRIANPNACAQSSAVSTVSARIEGAFFNAGGALPGSRYNDVIAGVMLYRLSNSPDASGVMRAMGYYGVCTDENCTGQQQFGTIDLGSTAVVGTPAQLEIRWDQVNHRFVFQKDSGTLAVLAYTISDTRAAQNSAKRLQITNDAANCVNTRVSVYGGADFDDVQTNGLP